MKSKRILKFYFFADGLNVALDNYIMKLAVSSGDHVRGGEYFAQRICALIEEKSVLGKLWQYLDGVLGGFSEREKRVLRFYGATRRGITSFNAAERREIKRVTVKFSRHAAGLARFAKGLELLGKYYCLLRA